MLSIANQPNLSSPWFLRCGCGPLTNCDDASQPRWYCLCYPGEAGGGPGRTRQRRRRRSALLATPSNKPQLDPRPARLTSGCQTSSLVDATCIALRFRKRETGKFLRLFISRRNGRPGRQRFHLHRPAPAATCYARPYPGLDVLRTPACFTDALKDVASIQLSFVEWNGIAPRSSSTRLTGL